MSTARELPIGTELLRNRMVETAEGPAGAAELGRTVFGRHRVGTASAGLLAPRLRRAWAGAVGLTVLSYGAAVRLDLDDAPRMQLVVLPLDASVTMRAGHAVVEADPGDAVLPPVRGRVELHVESGATLFVVAIRRDELLHVATVAYDLDAPRRLDLAPRLDLETPDALAFVRALRDLHRDLDGVGTRLAAVRRLAGELVVARLLEAVEHTVARSLGSWAPPRADDVAADEVVYRRFLTLVDRHVERATSVADLAAELDVPVRTLQAHVRRYADRTPSELLRDARFRRARELLVAAQPTRTTVAAVADRCGFAHHGRFATEYRVRFGEAPAATLRRS